jgi:site-specific recombinase XerD
MVPFTHVATRKIGDDARIEITGPSSTLAAGAYPRVSDDGRHDERGPGDRNGEGWCPEKARRGAARREEAPIRRLGHPVLLRPGLRPQGTSRARQGDAIRAYHERRRRAHEEAGWCPRIERQRDQERSRAEQERQARCMTFRDYAKEYVEWAKLHHRGWRTEQSRVDAMVKVFGERKLDAIATADVDRFLDGLLAKRSGATRNRYRTTLHAMYNRALRHAIVSVNPVRGLAKAKEPEGRTLYLTPGEEAAVRDQLGPDATRSGRRTLDARRGDLRPLFTVSVNTGLRWSEQRRLEWHDVDFLTGLITVRQSKSGHARQIPMNSIVRSVMVDLGSQRQAHDDPEAPVFRCPYVQPDKFIPKAIDQAQVALRQAGKDATRLDGYTWHCNRHTFASRLVMAGIDLQTVQVLGGWRTLAMVQRYSHLAPDHLRDAVERLVPASAAATNSTRIQPGANHVQAGVS